MAENRECWHSRYQSTKGIPTQTPQGPGTGLLLGTDFRHAVEFSRSRHTRTPAFRPSPAATFDVTPCIGWALKPSRGPQRGSHAAHRRSYVRPWVVSNE